MYKTHSLSHVQCMITTHIIMINHDTYNCDTIEYRRYATHNLPHKLPICNYMDVSRKKTLSVKK